MNLGEKLESVKNHTAPTFSTMKETIQENKSLIAVVLVLGLTGAVFAVNQTDIISSVTGTSGEEHEDTMQAQGDAMEAQGDAMKAEEDAMGSESDSMDSNSSMESETMSNDSMDSGDSMNDSMMENDSMSTEQ